MFGFVVHEYDVYFGSRNYMYVVSTKMSFLRPVDHSTRASRSSIRLEGPMFELSSRQVGIARGIVYFNGLYAVGDPNGA